MAIIVPICFLFSGIAGLIYEVLWAKYLALIFGGTAHAHTLVLATFMGGLALGNFLFGKLADRTRDPLLQYVRMEIGIGLCAALTPLLFMFSKNIYLSAAYSFSLDYFSIVILKFIIGALIMLPPTILMGGTLPMISKFLIRSSLVRGEKIAQLYYINSLGAVLGTILAGFYLIYTFGLNFSVTIAALFNVLPATAIYILQTFVKNAGYPEQAAPEAVTAQAPHTQEIFSGKLVKIALIAIFLSGFAAMLYEVAWIRLLSVILGSSTYSFSLMLAAFISGITIGSYIVHKNMSRIKSTFFAFGICEILAGLSLLAGLPFYDRLPFIFLQLSSFFLRTPQTFVLYSFIKFALCFLVMLPPTIFLGMTLPLVSKIASGRLEILGRKIGNVFALNTLGNILGALVVGLVMLPALGIQSTLEVGVIASLIIGCAILLADPKFSRRLKYSLAGSCVVIFLIYRLATPSWNSALFTVQVFRLSGNAETLTFKEFCELANRKKVLFYKDGFDTTVAVTENQETRTLYVAGKADASTTVDMPTQMLSAHLPLILRPQSKQLLIVGLGSGVTCGAALAHPVEAIDLVEISSSVVEANSFFAKANRNALADPRVRLHIEDARTFLQTNRKKYDLIMSEPSNPWMSGVSSLFTTEYFTDCLDHLNDGGLMLQWIQIYDMDDETYEIVLNTFRSVFPYSTLWSTGVSDSFLIGSKEKIDFDSAQSRDRVNSALVEKDLARINMKGLFTVLSLQLAGDKTLATELKQGTPPNSDYFPLLEYRAPINLFRHALPVNLLRSLDQRATSLERGDLLLAQYIVTTPPDYADIKNLFAYISGHQTLQDSLLFSTALRMYRDNPEDPAAQYAYSLANIDNIHTSISQLENLIVNGKRLEYLDTYARLQLKKFNSLRSFLTPDVETSVIEKLEMCARLAPDKKKAAFFNVLGDTNMKAKKYRDALAYFTKTEQLVGTAGEAQRSGIDYPALLTDICRCHLLLQDWNQAADYIRKLLQFDPRSAYAHSAIKYLQMHASPLKGK